MSQVCHTPSTNGQSDPFTVYPMPDSEGEAFTLLTTEPGPMWPLFTTGRCLVVLDRAVWLAWLDLTRPEADLLRPLKAGSLVVEQVR